MKYFQAQRHREQSAVLDGINVNRFYNEQVEYIEKWIENFKNQEGTGAPIDHCFRLYLNTAKYESLKAHHTFLYPNE